ncbi:MAG TPA: EF-hand domain-containing protein [Gemmataceae bacterium]|nr:EF-hand domain-containing protein [Gemmataceae bacterium]
MKRLMLAVLAAALLPAAAGAAPVPRVDPSSAPDVQDIIYYGKARPVLIRLHILVDGKPFSQAWESHIKKRFDYADRDRNGSLDRDEVKLVPSAQIFQQMLQNGGIFYGNMPPPRFEELDTDGDGKVTFAELKEYYQKLNLSAVRLLNTNQFYPNQGNALTEALFRHLDTNRDGKLSKEELAVADQLVGRLDSNDDETIDTAELLGGGQRVGVRPRRQLAQQPVPAMPGMSGMPGQTGSFVLVPKEKEANRLTQRLVIAKEMIARYDKDKSGKLTRDEIGLDEDLFNLLDRNQDRVLDAVELLRYVVVAPDVELTLRLGGKDRVKEPVTVTAGSKANLARSLRRVGPDAMTLGMQTSRIEVRSATFVNYNRQSNDAYFKQVFRTVDRENKGFVELKKLQDPQLQYLKGIFDLADHDGDGKVTLKEFDNYLALQAEAPHCVMTLSVAELGQGLFEILDTNSDGRLSVRELRSAWKRLSEYDHNHDGAVSESEIPHQFQLTLTPGANPYPYVRPIPGQVQPVRVATAGPLWFRKMDRNGDGDVSPREFLGTPEEFKLLDEDGDGYISLEEAEKADARLRKAKKLP